MTSKMTSKMNNTDIIQLNNSAVDALHAGLIEKGFKILSQTFYLSVRDRHQQHTLSSPKGSAVSGLEFSLQDCSRNIQQALRRSRPSESSSGHGDLGQFLCLHFLRIEIPTDEEDQHCVNQLCNCAVAWALGYNLSIVYSLIGYQGKSQASYQCFKKASRVLAPIKRQVMLQNATSPFWTNLKLCVLNNHICLQKEIGNSPVDITMSVQVMEKLLRTSRAHIDPMDVKKYYLSMQFLNAMTCLAAAA